jgi:hypothetical protein
VSLKSRENPNSVQEPCKSSSTATTDAATSTAAAEAERHCNISGTEFTKSKKLDKTIIKRLKLITRLVGRTFNFSYSRTGLLQIVSATINFYRNSSGLPILILILHNLHAIKPKLHNIKSEKLEEVDNYFKKT